MSVRISINWVGGEPQFALTIGNLRALQASCDAGPEQILHRITDGTWRIDDLIETLRQGLIGGGFKPETDAGPMVIRAAEQSGLAALRIPALRVLQASLLGEWDEPAEKPTGAETGAEAPESGVSANSTELEPS